MKDKKVIIVSSSPHLEGIRLGKLIDDYDIVVRMNQGYRLMKSLPKDYGSRVDMLFLNGWSTRQLSNKFLLDNYGITKEKIFNKHKSLKTQPNSNYKIPFITNHNLGVIAIFNLLEMGYTDITLTGYSFYLTDRKYSSKYISEDSKSPDCNVQFKEKVGHNQEHTVLNLKYFIENHNIKLLWDTQYYYDKFIKEKIKL